MREFIPEKWDIVWTAPLIPEGINSPDKDVYGGYENGITEDRFFKPVRSEVK